MEVVWLQMASLSQLRRDVKCAQCLLQGKWERKKYVGVSLVDKTLAIIGFGKVQWHIAEPF